MENGTFLSEFKPKFKRLRELDDLEKKLDVQIKALTQERDEITEALVEAMDEAGVGRVTLDGVTFYRKNDSYPRIKDHEGLHSWLHELGRGDMIKPTVNAQSLRSLVLERERQNQDVPECLELFVKKRVQTRG